MTKILGKVNSPRRVKYFLYRKTLTDIFKVFLRKKKFHRLNFQMMKRLEFLLFKRLVRWSIPKIINNKKSALTTKYNIKTIFKNRREGTKINYNLVNRLAVFNDNLLNVAYYKKSKNIYYNIYMGMKKLADVKRGKLGYLNWSLFYAGKPPTNNIIGGRKAWLNIERRKFFFKKKKFLNKPDMIFKRIALYYGFTNLSKFRKILNSTGNISRIRKATALNLEGRINMIIYKLSLVSNNIFLINKFVSRGRLLLNGTACYNPFHVLKVGDNVSISPKAYKFVINIFKKRLKNKKIWSAPPTYVEVNYLILHFSIINYPAVNDLVRIKGKFPYTIFNADIINMEARHFIQK